VRQNKRLALRLKVWREGDLNVLPTSLGVGGVVTSVAQAVCVIVLVF
jgi:hypothetical protein